MRHGVRQEPEPTPVASSLLDASSSLGCSPEDTSLLPSKSCRDCVKLDRCAARKLVSGPSAGGPGIVCRPNLENVPSKHRQSSMHMSPWGWRCSEWDRLRTHAIRSVNQLQYLGCAFDPLSAWVVCVLQTHAVCQSGVRLQHENSSCFGITNWCLQAQSQL